MGRSGCGGLDRGIERSEYEGPISARALLGHTLPPATASDGGLDTYDRIFGALSVRRRRYVLYYLEHTEPATITDVARHVAAWETDASPASLDEEAEPVRRVLASLYHHHLPKLADHGLVEYDPRSGDIRFRDCPDALLNVVALCRPRELPAPSFDAD